VTDRQEALEVETGPAPRAAVIWLHGLGADGHDFVPIVPELALPASLPVRFVFPHAPMRPVSINGGAVMRAWYDIVEVGGAWREEAEGVRDAARRVAALIARETGRGIAPDRVALAGFSQGGAIALHAGLRHPEALAGILALSCALPLADTLAAEASPANRGIPILMAHGTQDPLIPLARARRSRDRLLELRYAVDWREYAMPHSVSIEEIGDIAAWLRRILAQERAAR